MEFKIPIVIHVDYGGFTLTGRVHELLAERKVPWLKRCAKTADGRWFLPHKEDDELRRDPDLVEVVRELEGEFVAAITDINDWTARNRLEQQLLHGLKVVNVTVSIEIEEHDGKETVRVTGGNW